MSSAASLPVEARSTPIDWRTPVEILALAAVWGASFLFMRVSAGEFGALPLVELRLALGALVLLPFLWLERAAFPWRRWPILALIGAVNSAIPFALFAWAAQRAPAGVGAICNALAVLFTALIAALFFGERIGWRRAGALLIGFSGVVVLASSKTGGGEIGPAVAAGTLAAALYGLGANLVRKYLVGLTPGAVAAATLSCAAMLTLPFALATLPEQWPSARAIASVSLLGVLCTGIAFAVYYRLIKRIGAARAVTVTYLVPLFGVVWAWWLLGEPLTAAMAIAGLLIVGSVIVSQRR